MPTPQINVEGGDFLLNQQAVAVLADVSVPTLKRWHNLPNPPPRNADKSYSARAVGKWLATHRANRPKQGTPAKTTTDPDGTTRAEAETRLKIAQAEKIERENHVAEGLLVAQDDVVSGWQEILTRVRTRLTKLKVALPPLLVGLDDMAKIQSIIGDGVNDALTELSAEQDDDDEYET